MGASEARNLMKNVITKDSLTQDLYNIPVQTITGEETTLESYKGKVLLIVNVASRCGFTKQYVALEEMYRQYKNRGLVILAFPCNQFFGQEPGSNNEIKGFAESCYQITFPLFAKINVKGPQQAPLYQYLQTHLQKKPLKFMPWNFTKILVDTKGNIVRQYAPITSFDKLKQAVEELLPKT